MNKIMSNKAVIALFLVPGLLIFAFVFVYPILYTANLGFTSWKGLGPKEYIGFENYIKLFTSDTIFMMSLKNTVIILVTAVLGQLIPALFFALLLSGMKKRTRFFRVAFFIPVLLSTTAIALMWQKIYDVNYGLLNEALGLFQLAGWQHDWLTEEATCLIAAIVPVIWQWIGYHMIILYAGLKAIPEQYVEAARLDGANAFQTTIRVILPMLKSILKVCVVLAVVGSIKIFDNIYVMTGGGPYNLTTTIAIQMYKESFLKFNYGYGSAIAVLLCIVCVVVYLIINRLMAQEDLEY
ncbi:MAG TPA: sugar ABC transporter permease [Candidatus Pelethocola excrementipullorum]|nr:sugar ABC transporter permease [Candidatus Pelethocola excrementipullorum]